MVYSPNIRASYSFVVPVFVVLLVLVVGGSSVVGQSASTRTQKRVVILYPTRPDAPVPALIDPIFRKLLTEGLTGQLDLHSEYIDVVRFPEPSYQAALHEFLLSKYKNQQIDLMITFRTPPPNEFTTLFRTGLFKDIPVVYLLRDSERPDPNSTGVYYDFDVKKTLELALKLQPNTRRVFVVVGSSQVDQNHGDRARPKLQEFANQLEFTYLTNLTMTETLQTVANLPANSIILYIAITEDRAGNRFNTTESLDKISAQANAPIYATDKIFWNHGIVGGGLFSHEVLAAKASELALRILNGEKAANIPITKVDPYVTEVDWRQLKRWGISENALPPGSIVRFRELSAWEQYKWYVIGALAIVLGQAALIGWLLAERRNRRKSEEVRRHLAAIVESSNDAIIGTKLDGQVVSWNDGAELLYGYTAAEMLGRNLSILVPSESWEEFVESMRHRARGERIEHFETVRVKKDGTLIDVSVSVSPIKDARGKVIADATITRDVSDRRRAENERERLAVLVETEHRHLEEVISNVPGIVWETRFDSEGNFSDLFASQHLEKLLGYTLAEWQSDPKFWLTVVPQEERDEVLQQFNEIFEHGKEGVIQFRCRAKDGRLLWIEANVTVTFDENNLAKGLRGVSLDITDRKKAETSLHRALKELSELKDQLQQENLYLQEEIRREHNFEGIIGNSDELKYVLYKVERVAPTDSVVLIQGETGTGKELIARAIHGSSSRKNRPLVKINCAALPATLIESELFGHEKGAFTGAPSRKIGRFEVADGATLFLDEIGELPLELQPKLLRVLQDGEFERLGSTTTTKVDVRIIAATNRDLQAEVQKGVFREDLWYRLNVYPVTMPPLRERKNDISLLANSFIKEFSKKLGRVITSVEPKTITALQSYQWPGNVRELRNTIERAVINARGPVLQLVDKLDLPANGLMTSCEKSLEDLEREIIIQRLEAANWRISGLNGAAQSLGLHPNTLRTRMLKLNIRRESASESRSSAHHSG